ncbi:hypothetical protein EJ05DRAFT_477953 [Pseudovirgaria hyperparasitica]|uniref:WHIM1 domain-containing protein n=1 Tax=Pseudovirgaria hyperparasitica TaxID=470096 RepID=A0A6A6W183_9PEZI|nr:uncharacterized protein EJ05DRAFT_477953 [Pseudovirgaria hyperparasitica]KAF2755889.1 hypothetical protein EJ05DRAFT_477953 [Pseudovirgaria hyperparasitica]
MSDTDSSLSEPPPSDEELEIEDIVQPAKKLKLKKSKRKVDEDDDLDAEDASPAKKKRAASPPHELVFEDNADIAFIVMFRARFADVFPPKGVINFGPQDLERAVTDSPPGPMAENLLCSLLYLVLNRQKPPERGHYGRALEEAISANRAQWPRVWNGTNPLLGANNFITMSPIERLILLKTLIHWSLNESTKIKDMIKESYKQARHDDDRNQPLSVQPWGRDSDKRRYWLIEGKDDTVFRLYRESNPALKTNVWISVAGTLEELRTQAGKLGEEGSQAARRLAESIKNGIIRLEATEEKRKRREYRQSRKAQFTRPEPGFSLYEGRTRGKRMRYTFSDEEDDASEAGSGARSTRYRGRDSSTDPSRPTVTASGRQVRTRQHGAYGESLLSGQVTGDVGSPATDGSDGLQRPSHGRATRAAAKPAANGWSRGSRNNRNIDTYDSDEIDEDDGASVSGNEWDDGDESDDEVKARDVSDEDEDMSDAEAPSLVTVLRYGEGKEFTANSTSDTNEDKEMTQVAAPPSARTQEPKASSAQTARPESRVLNRNGQPVSETVSTAPAAPTAGTAPTLVVPATAPIVTTAAQVEDRVPPPASHASPPRIAYPLTNYAGPANGFTATPAIASPPAQYAKPLPVSQYQASQAYPLTGTPVHTSPTQNTSAAQNGLPPLASLYPNQAASQE